MLTDELSTIIEALFPQLMLMPKGIGTVKWGEKVPLDLGGESYIYVSYRSSWGGEMGTILDYVAAKSPDYLSKNLDSSSIEKEYICRDIVTKWLDIKSTFSQSEWKWIIDCVVGLLRRTNENAPCVYNLVLSPVIAKSSVSLVDGNWLKVLDILGSSINCFVKIDKNMHLIDYGSVMYDEMRDKCYYNSVPHFLVPIAEKLESEEIGISITHSQDLIIFKSNEMLASLRKGKWIIYEGSIVKNFFRDALNCGTAGTKYHVGCNIFDLIWDISYRRHGALLIATEGDLFTEHIINKSSVINDGSADDLRRILKDAVDRISLGNNGKLNGRSMLLELLSVDGAVVVDKSSGKILSYGSIIETSKDLDGVRGARSTAAESAIRYEKMWPIKVSSDGEITLYIKTEDEYGNVVILRNELI